jgi:hypothetical protein
MTLYRAIGTVVSAFPEGSTEQVQGRWRKRRFRSAFPFLRPRCLALCLVVLDGTWGPRCTRLASGRHSITSLAGGRSVRRRVGGLLPTVGRQSAGRLHGLWPRRVVIWLRQDGRRAGVAGMRRLWRAIARRLLKIGGGACRAAGPARVAGHVIRMVRLPGELSQRRRLERLRRSFPVVRPEWRPRSGRARGPRIVRRDSLTWLAPVSAARRAGSSATTWPSGILTMIAPGNVVSAGPGRHGRIPGHGLCLRRRCARGYQVAGQHDIVAGGAVWRLGKPGWPAGTHCHQLARCYGGIVRHRGARCRQGRHPVAAGGPAPSRQRHAEAEHKHDERRELGGGFGDRCGRPARGPRPLPGSPGLPGRRSRRAGRRGRARDLRPGDGRGCDERQRTVHHPRSLRGGRELEDPPGRQGARAYQAPSVGLDPPGVELEDLRCEAAAAQCHERDLLQALGDPARGRGHDVVLDPASVSSWRRPSRCAVAAMASAAVAGSGGRAAGEP